MNPLNVVESLQRLLLSTFPSQLAVRSSVVLFGAVPTLGAVVAYLRAAGLRPTLVMDNGPALPPRLDDLPIVRPSAEVCRGAYVLILARAGAQAIRQELESFGLREEHDFCTFHDRAERTLKTSEYTLHSLRAKASERAADGLFPWYSLASAERNGRAFLASAGYLARAGKSFAGASVLELGCGATLVPALLSCLLGSARTVAVDAFPQPGLFDEQQVRDLAGFLFRHGPSCWPQPTQAARLIEELDQLVDYDRGYVVPNAGRLTVRVPCTTNDLVREGETFDICYSTVVLEHVREPGAVVRELSALARPGCVMFHQIDLSGHEGEIGAPRFYGLTRAEAREQLGRVQVNTLRKSEWVDLFAREGWEIVEALSQHELPEGDWSRDMLAEEYRGMSDDDIRCMYLCLLVKRPPVAHA